MPNFLEFKVAREQIDRKYNEMGYDRARETIKYLYEADLISLSTRASLMSYLNAIDELKRDYKRKKRQHNKKKKKKK